VTLKFWGTRGSIPTPGRWTGRFGGNTTCLEMRHQETLLVFDAGSGVRELGNVWMNEFADTPIDAHLLFTHLHWDHIQGFPFFAPAFREGNTLTLYGEDRPGRAMRDVLGGQMQEEYFPVPLSAMKADLRFEPAADVFRVEDLTVRTRPLPHPGGCMGYRVEAGGSTFVFATDCELDQVALNAREVGADLHTPRRHDVDLLDFFAGANLLVIDCQYTDEEYPEKRGWGHNSIAAVVDLCTHARPDMLALFHHDPQRSDRQVAAMVTELRRRLEERTGTRHLVFAAREGLHLEVEKPLRPVSLT
jgi:phosphoribosyl 1,2-cyclic phosphodiesterase